VHDAFCVSDRIKLKLELTSEISRTAFDGHCCLRFDFINLKERLTCVYHLSFFASKSKKVVFVVR